MTSEAITHATTAQTFTDLVEGVTNWDAPTPVPEWRAPDVVEHLLTWPMPVLGEWADLQLTDDPSSSLLTRWKQRTADLQAALDSPMVASRTVNRGPFAGQSVGVMVDRVYTADVYMHTWDLARATDQRAELDPTRAHELLEGLRPMEEVLRGSGQYGPAHPTNSEDPIERLVAFIGRDPKWTPPIDT